MSDDVTAAYTAAEVIVGWFGAHAGTDLVDVRTLRHQSPQVDDSAFNVALVVLHNENFVEVRQFADPPERMLVARGLKLIKPKPTY